MDLLKIETVEMTPDHGLFHVEQLEPGFGVTLGNALRRVLLSQLPGAAIDTVRIDGVYHEFSEVPGVKEDTTELILNLKQVRLRSTIEHPEPLRLEVSGPGRVTAADIKCPPEVEIINPELYLFTLDNSESRVSLELTVRRGKGYLPADRREGLPIGMVPVDAIFTPIRRVNYSVETIHRGVENLERLVLDIQTDGTIRPDEAIAESAQILVKHMTVFVELGGATVPQLEPRGGGSSIPDHIYNISIEDLELSPRVYNGLKRAGITRVGQILEKDEDELLSIRNFGQKSLEELREHLQARGLLHSTPATLGGSDADDLGDDAFGLGGLTTDGLTLGGDDDDDDEDATFDLVGSTRAPAATAATAAGATEEFNADLLGGIDDIPLDEEEGELPIEPARPARAKTDRKRIPGVPRRRTYDEDDEEDF